MFLDVLSAVPPFPSHDREANQRKGGTARSLLRDWCLIGKITLTRLIMLVTKTMKRSCLERSKQLQDREIADQNSFGKNLSEMEVNSAVLFVIQSIFETQSGQAANNETKGPLAGIERDA